MIPLRVYLDSAAWSAAVLQTSRSSLTKVGTLDALETPVSSNLLRLVEDDTTALL